MSLPTKIIAVIVACCFSALCVVSSVGAQTSVKSFGAYLNRLPPPSSAPDDGFLQRANPDLIDASSDIDNLERQLQTYLVSIQGDNLLNRNRTGQQATATRKKVSKQAAVTQSHQVATPVVSAQAQSLNPKNVVSDDSCLAIANQLQHIESAFNASYRAIEEAYNYNISVAYERWRAERKQYPCGSDAECIAAQTMRRNINVIGAAKTRINSNASVITAQIRQLVPMIETVDNIMPKHIMSVASPNTRTLLKATSSNARNILLLLSERIKLNRIYIANCAKLAQEK